MAKPRKTLYEKIWDAHVVERREDGTACSTSTATSSTK